MKFWDASAVVALVVREAESRRCRQWLRQDPIVLVWALTATEVISALTRKQREGALRRPGMVSAKQRLGLLEAAWAEVAAFDAVRARARRLLETHPLRAADALQLAAALVAAEEEPGRFGFVTFDERLATAAEKEGFAVLGGRAG